MATVKEFWVAVRAEEARLTEEFYYVTALPDRTTNEKGGAVFQVNRRYAAKLFVAGKHRMSTDEEVKAYLAAGNMASIATINTEQMRIARLIANPIEPQMQPRNKGVK